MATPERPIPDRQIIVFDGECLLCSAGARFVLSQDRRGRFLLATMQGEAGRALMEGFGIDPDDPATMILVSGDTAQRDSDAVLAVLMALGGPWRLAALARRVPRGLRDGLYRWIARNRYRLVGRRRTCWMPPPAWRERML